METVLQAIKATPWWVYILFFYVLYIGIRALKSRTMSVNRIFIIPLLFLFWSIWSLIARFQGAMDLLIWGIFIVIGFTAGWGLFQRYKIRADHKKLLIRFPGNYFILILMLSIFAVKYFFGYMRATSPELSPMLHSLNFVVSGLSTGLFVGRTFAILKKFGKAKHEKLKKS